MGTGMQFFPSICVVPRFDEFHELPSPKAAGKLLKLIAWCSALDGPHALPRIPVNRGDVAADITLAESRIMLGSVEEVMN